MIFSLDVRRARKGDCLLLHYGTEADPGLMVIDGGPSHVYQPHLKPRLEAIRKARGLGRTEALELDVVMVSHVDDDHINGILEMTGELVLARNAQRPLPYRPRTFWHNSFDDIIGNDPEELLRATTAAYGAAALSPETEYDGICYDVAKVLSSVAQGFSLRDDIRRLRTKVNRQFDGGLVAATAERGAVDMGRGLSFTVAGPMLAELTKLQKEHAKFLKAQEKKQREAALASFTDTSVANLSSLVVLAEAGGKSILLTGDARGDKLVEGMELAGLLAPGGTRHVDVFKMPHHGSDRNMEKSVLQRITADHYVFSGDGEHGNPERDTLDMLRRARSRSDAYAIHLTYPVDEIDREREADWKKEQQRERKRRARATTAAARKAVKVRPDWSPEKHSLEGFFAKHPDMAARVVVADEQRHVIDLLQPLPY